MIKFDSSPYFSISTDRTVKWADNYLCLPTSQGLQLAIDYYTNKYQCSIEIPSTKLNDFVESQDESTFFENISEQLDRIRKESENLPSFRKGFILNADSTHAVPFLYVKEEGEEAIIYANSKGVTRSKWQIDLINECLSKSGDKIEVLGIEETRQADDHSCFMDALIFCKDATAKTEKGEYYIPNLLAQLKGRSTLKEGYTAVKLPNELLKTAQISSFVHGHRENNTHKTIHQHHDKLENLSDFRKRNSDFFAKIKGKIKFQSPNYLRQKSLKVAEKIVIQFYINQLIEKYGESFTPSDKNRFINLCKSKFSKLANPKDKDIFKTVVSFQHQLEEKLSKKENRRSLETMKNSALEGFSVSPDSKKLEKSTGFPFWKIKAPQKVDAKDTETHTMKSLELG
ncbi:MULTISPECIES: hypothetical protein [Legionella]|uniref:Dot/Icm T4SS effector n=1 Tax=Legionella maceachernii TaxID=466 RepID=A0A0W0VW77_9GAMM|nr:hypothetical protein [Legionella maceachernii]KTD24238.1 hypothetical protein Lmac_3111 [Legionella maceachernii]SJZ89909.1 hypothetical protein SAMN02745128_01408 [Legionella maceachernii]SUO98745.1 Uncharacterised protein [Legionella maceachernii]